jgi:hypothetical protein
MDRVPLILTYSRALPDIGKILSSHQKILKKSPQLRKIFQNYSNLNPMNNLKANIAGMCLGLSFTKRVFFGLWFVNKRFKCKSLWMTTDDECQVMAIAKKQVFTC